MEYLTKAEQRVLERLPGGSFSLSEVAAGMDARYRCELVNRLVRKKALMRVKKGLYFSDWNKPQFHLRAALSLSRGYLGFATALKHYGLLDEELSRVFVATKNKRGRKSFAGFDVEFVPLGEDFYGLVEEDELRWSTPAKTFFDCFKKPEHAGGYGKLLDALEKANLSGADWREWSYYLVSTSSKSLKQKTGFLLQAKAPDWFLKKLENAIGKKAVVFLDYGKTRGFDKRWSVYYGPRS